MGRKNLLVGGKGGQGEAQHGRGKKKKRGATVPQRGFGVGEEEEIGKKSAGLRAEIKSRDKLSERDNQFKTRRATERELWGVAMAA